MNIIPILFPLSPILSYRCAFIPLFVWERSGGQQVYEFPIDVTIFCRIRRPSWFNFKSWPSQAACECQPLECGFRRPNDRFLISVAKSFWRVNLSWRLGHSAQLFASSNPGVLLRFGTHFTNMKSWRPQTS